MNGEKFVDILKDVVLKQTVNNTKENLLEPSGKKPPEDLLEMSKFYNNLDSNNRRILHNLIYMVAEDSLFGFLCVLDGVRAIEDNEVKGELKLYYDRLGTTTLINDINDDYLHDLI